MFFYNLTANPSITRYLFLLIAFKDIFPDKATERKILSLAIKCPSQGCDWAGELRNKEVKTVLQG